ncbi:DUF3515 family protein [Frondihabitans cladoniiphilus]|uniref:DUF3515 family protein n=1 Tax=Frondihabitans cladoniiphilus TaxID=715785 RepID=A0ABP8VJ90_9MICO
MSVVSRRLVSLLVVAAALPVLAGCSSTVSLSPSPLANTVGCADVTVHLPTTLDSKFAIRDTDAQGTAVWGSPAAVVLHCGITTPAVSDLACYTVEGVDWLVDQQKSTAVYTTYGRVPGVQVVASSAASSNVLFDLGSAVGTLKQTKKCESASDAPGSTPSATPAPTPTP